MQIITDRSESSKLKMYYQNIRGMRTKSKAFFEKMIANGYDVILLCETWLNDNFYDSEFFDNRYIVFRIDRNKEETGMTLGGGCLVAIKSNLASMRMREWEMNKEDVWLSIVHDNGHKTYLNVRYIEGESKLPEYEVHFKRIGDVVATADVNDRFVLFGDYNLSDSVTWHAADGTCDPKVNSQSNFDKRIPNELLNLNALCDFKQVNRIRNELERTIDLVLTDVDLGKIEVSRCLDPLVSEDAHHPALEVVVDVNPIKYLAERRSPKVNFYKANYPELNEKLRNVEWEIELSGLDVNEAVNRFYEIIDPLIECIPKVHYSKRDYPVYFTPKLIKLIKKKANAKKKVNVDDNELNKGRFSRLRKQVKREIKACFGNYVSDCETKLRDNTKCFFAFTKSLRKTNSLANSMKYGDSVSNDRETICNFFASFFDSVYQKDDDNEVSEVCSFEDQVNDVIGNISFSVSDVKKVLKGFDVNKVASPDGVPMMFYKNLAETLALPLSILFNLSLSSRVFPEKWKIGFVSPIFKDGDKHEVTNYRAVSILCAISKVFERLMFNELFDRTKDKICRSQHGFFSKRSTQSNLIEFVTAVSKSMANGGQVDVLYTDFSKAFDKILHSRLLGKIAKFGFDEPLIQWFKSYLTDRSQFVVIGSGRSRKVTPTSGVPQGSILGPFLFILYVNDLLSHLHNSFAFADDLKLLKKIVSIDDSEVFQLEIDRLHEWCSVNKLGLNVKKCAVMSITRKAEVNKVKFNYKINNEVIPRVNSKRDLGVTIDSKLSFAEHIGEVTRKAYQMLGFIFRCGKFFKKPESMMTLYNSLVRSRLDYCAAVWSPIYVKHINIVERVQKKFTRMYFYKFNLEKTEYEHRLKTINITSLKTRRLKNDEMILHKIIHGHMDTVLSQSINYNIHGRILRRNRPLFYTPTYSSNIVQNEPLHRMQDNHDKFFSNCDIFNESINAFKKSVMETIVEQTDYTV